MTFDTFKPEYLPRLYEIFCRAFNGAMLTRQQFDRVIVTRNYIWIVKEGPKIIGCLSLGEYIPDVEISLHVFIDPDHQRRWITRGLIKTTMDTAFNLFNAQRCTSYLIEDENRHDPVRRLLLGMKFKKEGVLCRRFLAATGEYKDLEVYTLLKEENPWR
jgi:RimJ/RimL family protein N-acetyltransferase